MAPQKNQKITLQNDPSRRPPLIHVHKAQDCAEINIIRYLKRVKTELFSSKSVRFSKQISYSHISAPIRDNPSKIVLGGRQELWRRHQNLYLLANQDDLTPERFNYSGFITEIQRFFSHIGNLWNLNSFEILQFPIEFTLQITWTFKCYDPKRTL